MEGDLDAKASHRLLAAFGAAGCALLLTTAPAGAQELPLPVPTPPPLPVPDLPVPPLPIPPAPPVPDGPLVNVSPDVAVGVCGNGVAIAGTGTTSDCSDQQSSASSDGDAAINVDPTVQAGVCGNGVSVAGTGTTAVCSAQAASDPGPDNPGNGGGGGEATLPVTGFEPVVMALAGLALTSVGGVARLRVLGS